MLLSGSFPCASFERVVVACVRAVSRHHLESIAQRTGDVALVGQQVIAAGAIEVYQGVSLPSPLKICSYPRNAERGDFESHHTTRSPS